MERALTGLANSTTLTGARAPEPDGELGTITDHRTDPRQRFWWLLCGGLVIACVVAGVVGRGWWITHEPFDSDQAVVGLMANSILHGHFTAFFWGQDYGGGEPFLVAALVGVFGSNWLPLMLTPALLMVVTSLLTWRVALRLVEDRWLAALAGAVVWMMPVFGLTNTTEFGFRNLTLALGVAFVLLSLRVLDGRSGFLDFCALGLVGGVGWWSSPEIVYYLLPGLLLTTGAVVIGLRERRARFWLARIAAASAAAVVGALPWLWSNVPDGFDSLKTSSGATPTGGDFISHLHVFFAQVVPLQLGLRGWAGVPIVGGVTGSVLEKLAFAVLAVSLVMCCTRPGRAWAIATGVVAFPFLYAINPIAWWWQDGRYSEYLPPLIALVLVIGCERASDILTSPGARRPARSHKSGRDGKPFARIAMATLVTLLLLASGFGFRSFATGAEPLVPTGDPNSPTTHVVSLLEHDHVDLGYANYWVAYKLDYLSAGKLDFSPGAGVEARSKALYQQVERDRRAAWLFVPPDQVQLAGTQFGTINVEPTANSNVKPGQDAEAAFVVALERIGVPYRLVHAGFVDAVVPLVPLRPAEIEAVLQLVQDR